MLALLKVIGFLTAVAMTVATIKPDRDYPGTDPFGPSVPWRGGTVFHEEAIGGIPGPVRPATLEEADRRVPERIHSTAMGEDDGGITERVDPPVIRQEERATSGWSISAPVSSAFESSATAPAPALALVSDEPVLFKQRNLSGPRIGMTLALNQEQADQLRARGMGPFISQFGWHFERQIVPLGGGPQFVVESVPMVGGVEYGEFIPSLTLAMGVRFPSGAEFGLGPSISASPVNGGSSSLVIAAGRSFDYGGVSLPVNVALSTNPHSQRLSLVLGYAIQQVH